MYICIYIYICIYAYAYTYTYTCNMPGAIQFEGSGIWQLLLPFIMGYRRPASKSGGLALFVRTCRHRTPTPYVKAGSNTSTGTSLTSSLQHVALCKYIAGLTACKTRVYNNEILHLIYSNSTDRVTLCRSAFNQSALSGMGRQWNNGAFPKAANPPSPGLWHVVHRVILRIYACHRPWLGYPNDIRIPTSRIWLRVWYDTVTQEAHPNKTSSQVQACSIESFA